MRPARDKNGGLVEKGDWVQFVDVKGATHVGKVTEVHEGPRPTLEIASMEDCQTATKSARVCEQVEIVRKADGSLPGAG